MKTNQILIGGGLIAIGLYLYNKNKKAKSVETPSTGGESPLPPPDKMPTPVPQLPKEDNMREEVYYCKDGFREVIRMTESQWQVSRIAPCLKHGGIDEAKTRKNEGGGVQGSSTPIKGGSTKNDLYVEYTISSGKVFKGAKLNSNFAVFGDEIKSQYDKGGRSAKKGTYKVLNVTKDGVPFGQYQKKINMDGFEFWDGAIGDIMLTKDIVVSYQNKPIIYT